MTQNLYENGAISREVAREYYLDAKDIYQAPTGTLFCNLNDDYFMIINAGSMNSDPFYKPSTWRYSNKGTRCYAIFKMGTIPDEFVHIKENGNWLCDAKEIK